MTELSDTGTHNHRPVGSCESGWSSFSSSNRLWLWVPAFTGTTSSEVEVCLSIRSEHELAVAFEIRAGPHVELPVLPDEEQRALRHFLGALQEHTGVVGPHLVGRGLAFLVVSVSHVR